MTKGWSSIYGCLHNIASFLFYKNIIFLKVIYKKLKKNQNVVFYIQINDQNNLT